MIGSGTAGKICALDLAGDGHHVTLISKSQQLHDYPIIIPEPALKSLLERMPFVVAAFESAGARHIVDEDILSQRFKSEIISNSKDNVGMLCLSARAMDKALTEIVAHHPLIKMVEATVTALLKRDGKIGGVIAGANQFQADYVIDASGASSQRRRWLEDIGMPFDRLTKSGPAYVCYTRNFRSAGPSSFRLFSKKKWRGGIYPIGQNEFAVSIFTIQSEARAPNADIFFEQALTSIATQSEISKWVATTPFTVVSGIQRRQSDFFSRGSRTKGLKGFIPLGDSLFTSNPVYGRSLSSILLQTAALKNAVATENVWDFMYRKIPAIYKVTSMGHFRDLADEQQWGFKTLLPKLINRYYHIMLEPLEGRDPEYFKTLLDVYQMRRNPSALAHPKFQWRSIKNLFSKAG